MSVRFILCLSLILTFISCTKKEDDTETVTLQGQALNATGPIAGAQVQVFAIVQGSRNAVGSGITGEDGSFSVVVTAQSNADGYEVLVNSGTNSIRGAGQEGGLRALISNLLEAVPVNPITTRIAEEIDLDALETIEDLAEALRETLERIRIAVAVQIGEDPQTFALEIVPDIISVLTSVDIDTQTGTDVAVGPNVGGANDDNDDSGLTSTSTDLSTGGPLAATCGGGFQLANPQTQVTVGITGEDDKGDAEDTVTLRRAVTMALNGTRPSGINSQAEPLPFIVVFSPADVSKSVNIELQVLNNTQLSDPNRSGSATCNSDNCFIGSDSLLGTQAAFPTILSQANRSLGPDSSLGFFQVLGASQGSGGAPGCVIALAWVYHQFREPGVSHPSANTNFWQSGLGGQTASRGTQIRVRNTAAEHVGYIHGFSRDLPIPNFINTRSQFGQLNSAFDRQISQLALLPVPADRFSVSPPDGRNPYNYQSPYLTNTNAPAVPISGFVDGLASDDAFLRLRALIGQGQKTLWDVGDAPGGPKDNDQESRQKRTYTLFIGGSSNYGNFIQDIGEDGGSQEILRGILSQMGGAEGGTGESDGLSSGQGNVPGP